MASTVTIRTKAITREKLAQFFPGNHELVRLLESLAQDVVVNLPSVVNSSTVTIDESSDEIATVAAAVASVQALALQAFGLGLLASDGPPAPVQVAPAIPDDVYAQLAALRERVAVAERRIAELKEGPTP